MGLPISCNDIINLPMDEFNDLLSKHELTEEQLTLCRDIRRRGKNKVKLRTKTIYYEGRIR
jgi:nuclear factor erythroid 2